jgi:hypothetical protein
MASLNLSAVFDLVNTKLLNKQLEVIGIPSDVVCLIRIWLTNRSFYVTIDGKNLILIELVCGTVQGSILGPIFYAIYVSPLFDLHNLTSFADDNFIVRRNMHMLDLIVDMVVSLEAMAKWLWVQS